MKAIYSLVLAVSTAILVQYPVLAEGNPPVDPTQAAVPATSLLTGFPWGLLAVFVAAGFIMTYIKRNNPNKVTSSSCLPLIDEEQQAREKEQIAREEAEKNNS
jgi:hypothetical protein